MAHIPTSGFDPQHRGLQVDSKKLDYEHGTIYSCLGFWGWGTVTFQLSGFYCRSPKSIHAHTFEWSPSESQTLQATLTECQQFPPTRELRPKPVELPFTVEIVPHPLLLCRSVRQGDAGLVPIDFGAGGGGPFRQG